jgi:hypothetical protein
MCDHEPVAYRLYFQSKDGRAVSGLEEPGRNFAFGPRGVLLCVLRILNPYRLRIGVRV